MLISFVIKFNVGLTTWPGKKPNETNGRNCSFLIKNKTIHYFCYGLLEITISKKYLV